jgi:hydrophobic/amphiphilic exporter-1 (mainly G- bacteria), HAE1 family
MISKFFIDRPVLANVLAILMIVIGGVALFSLPVSQYPNVVPPTIQVTTSYPGASARNVMDTVAVPIEQQVNGVDGMIYMQSYSGSDGSYSLTVTFRIGMDINAAQMLVQNRVSSALASLPPEVQAQGVVVQQKSTAILQFVTLTSSNPTHDSLFLANYATINLKDRLARVPGVGNVVVLGAGQYSMRVWLDPEKLQARSLTTQDVVQALKAQNQEVAAGQLGMPPTAGTQPFQYTLDIAGRLDKVSQFENIVVKTAQDGRMTYLRDVARIELGAQSYGQIFTLNGQPAAGIAIYQTLEANALDVAGRVRAQMAGMAPSFPQGLTYSIPFDTTTFVRASIDEVYKTLFEAGILVLVVILVFLQDWRAMLVPTTTVPVTIIGTFAVMAALGFTVNLSTLFAIVLAIGIVVDDAIVVVERAAHHIEQRMPRKQAAAQAMNELFGPIIGITLVLMCVFVPAAFIPGLTGRIYSQFALVIAATALLSAVNAVTLKPTQCALWLRTPTPPDRRNAFYRAFNAVYGRLENAYSRLIGRMITRSGLMCAIALVVIGMAIYGLIRVPTGFLPIEDQGYVLVSAQLPDGASLGRTKGVLDRVTEIARKTPGVDQVIAISGLSALDNNSTLANAGVAYVVLKDWSKRGKGEDLRSLFENLNRELGAVKDARILVLPPPPIQGIGNAAGFAMQLELRDGSVDLTKLQSITNTVVRQAQTQSALQRVASNFRATVPQMKIDVDRAKAETLQVSLEDVFSTLSAYLGSSYVDQFNKFGRTFQVYVQADSESRSQPEDIELLTVRNNQGKMIPLGTLVTITPATGPSLLSLYNLAPSSTVLGLPATGFSSGEAIAVMEQLATKALPRGAAYEWTGMSYQEKLVGNQAFYMFAIAMLLMYLVLAGQYESWLMPFAVLLAVPLSLVGPVLALNGLGIANNLYTQIGLVLLLALSAKNAILIVEVAYERRLIDGKPLLEAAVEAARTRFRPILMTSFAFILGVLPLVLATGAGASARKSIGIAVCSGMIASTCLAVLFVPSFFVVIRRFEEWWAARKCTETVEAGDGDGRSFA